MSKLDHMEKWMMWLIVLCFFGWLVIWATMSIS